MNSRPDFIVFQRLLRDATKLKFESDLKERLNDIIQTGITFLDTLKRALVKPKSQTPLLVALTAMQSSLERAKLQFEVCLEVGFSLPPFLSLSVSVSLCVCGGRGGWCVCVCVCECE